MAVYIVTGSLGAGKSMQVVGQLRQYAEDGRRIAGNIDINLEALTRNPRSKATYSRVPDFPTAADLDAIGSGNDSYDESKNGALVLDELATSMNARSWNDSGRKELINWMVHARKKGWDVFLLIQHFSALDSQLKDLVAEFHADCLRLDKLAVPILSSLWRMATGKRWLPLPKVHMARVSLMRTQIPLTVDRWVVTGTSLYAAYDTRQVFTRDYEHGPHCLLSAWHTKGRYMPPPISKLSLFWRIPLAIYIKAFSLITRTRYDFKKGTFV